jgi:SOS-response transcriptional repressor LexA
MHHSTTEAVYAFIEAYIQNEGLAPSIREIAAGCHLSRATVPYHLNRLDAWGWIVLLPGKARGIVLVDKERERS